MEKINVCVVDDHKIFRKAMMRLLYTFDRMGEITEAESGKECIESFQVKCPHVVLLDLEMPGMNGMDCAEQLIQKFPDLKIIILTMHDSEKYMLFMLELGVHSFLLKSTDPDELEKAIHAVADRDYYHNELMSSVIRRSMQSKIKSSRPDFSPAPALTEREKEIIRLICEEKTIKEIATHFFVSEKTVHTHKYNIQTKLNVKSTVGILRAAYELGILS